MTAEASTVSMGRPDEMIFEEKPSGMIWIFFALASGLCVALFVAAMPPTTIGRIAGAAASALAAAFLITITVHGYRTRNDSQRFFGDRVEVLRNGQRLHSLPYANVHTVAYGFRNDNDQFLKIVGPNDEPVIVLSLVGDKSDAKPTELTEAKLLAVRDLVQEVVTERKIGEASQPTGTAWFDRLRLTRNGLHTGSALVPWSDLVVDADESNGSVVIRGTDGVIARTSMIEDNVVAGLNALERLRGDANA